MNPLLQPAKAETQPADSHITILVAITVIVAACLIFFSSGLFANARTILWDTADYYYPGMWYNSQLWQSGSLPLWNPYLFNGYPVFADPQNQTFYPLNFFIYLFTKITAKTVYVQLVIHFMLAGIFMYLFLGHYVQSLAGRLVGSLIYMFNGYMINHFQHLTIINSLAYLPLILYFLEKGWRSRRLIYALPAGVSVMLLFLGGLPQIELFIMYLLLSYSLYKCSWYKSRDFFPVLLFICTAAFGIALSAIQLLPTYEFSRMANRAGVLPSWVLQNFSGNLNFSHLATLLIPDFQGSVRGPYIGSVDITYASVYTGIIFIAALPFSLLRLKKDTIFFLSCCFITLLISAGESSLLFGPVFSHLPGFSLFRSPVQYRFGFCFFGAVLAGIGIDNIIDKVRLSVLFLKSYYVAIVLALIGLVFFAHDSSLHDKIYVNILLDSGTALFCLSVFAVSAVSWWSGVISRTVFSGILVLLCFSDLYLHGANASTLGSRGRHADLAKMTDAVRDVSELQGKYNISDPAWFYRSYIDDGLADHTKYFPFFAYTSAKLGLIGCNRSVFHSLFMVDGYNPMMLKRYVYFNGVLRDKDYQKFLMLSNVKYVITPEGVTPLPDNLTLPRAYIISDVVSMTDPDKVLDQLSRPSFDVRSRAIVEGEWARAGDKNCVSRTGRATMLSYRPDMVEIQTEGGCAGLLVLSDTYYPGWKVKTDNGRQSGSLRVNYLFRGVSVPAGSHTITFTFEPRSLKIGSWISALTGAAGLLLGLIILIRGLYRRKNE